MYLLKDFPIVFPTACKAGLRLPTPSFAKTVKVARKIEASPKAASLVLNLTVTVADDLLTGCDISFTATTLTAD